MEVNLAHLQERSTAGTPIDFAVFDARSSSGSDADNRSLLGQLTATARASGLRVDQAALAFRSNGRNTFFGSKHLVDYLSHRGVPRWTHTINV